jgi:hypothetical protein
MGWIAAILSSAMVLARSGIIRIPKGRTQRRYGPGLTGPVVRVCPGGRHAWLSTSAGIIRKPYQVTP